MNKKENAGVLCNVSPCNWQLILDHILTDRKKTRCNREVALQKDNENIMNAAYNQRGIFDEQWTQKYTCSFNQKYLLRIHNKENGVETLIQTRCS